MKKIVVTNNKKVNDRYANKFEVRFTENASNLDILQEGKEIAVKGGKVLHDPTRNAGDHYKSLVFYIGDKDSETDVKTVEKLDKAIDIVKSSGKISSADKKPLLAGVLQNKDLDVVKKILD